jgi:hypothetical protein
MIIAACARVKVRTSSARIHQRRLRLTEPRRRRFGGDFVFRVVFKETKMAEPRDENLLHFLASAVESIGDRMESGFTRLETRMEALGARMDAGFTAVRGDVERVHIRIDTIERLISARLDRVETEVSRLRSVVYLLVKDRPELLRLLGETPLA